MKKGRFRSPAISYFAATKNEGCGHDHRTDAPAQDEEEGPCAT